MVGLLGYSSNHEVVPVFITATNSVCACVRVCGHVSFFPVCVSACLSTPVYLSSSSHVCVYVCLSTCMSLSLCLPVFLSLFLWCVCVCVSVCLYVCLFACLFICLSVPFFRCILTYFLEVESLGQIQRRGSQIPFHESLTIHHPTPQPHACLLYSLANRCAAEHFNLCNMTGENNISESFPSVCL